MHVLFSCLYSKSIKKSAFISTQDNFWSFNTFFSLHLHNFEYTIYFFLLYFLFISFFVAPFLCCLISSRSTYPYFSCDRTIFPSLSSVSESNSIAILSTVALLACICDALVNIPALLIISRSLFSFKNSHASIYKFNCKFLKYYFCFINFIPFLLKMIDSYLFVSYLHSALHYLSVVYNHFVQVFLFPVFSKLYSIQHNLLLYLITSPISNFLYQFTPIIFYLCVSS